MLFYHFCDWKVTDNKFWKRTEVFLQFKACHQGQVGVLQWKWFVLWRTGSATWTAHIFNGWHMKRLKEKTKKRKWEKKKNEAAGVVVYLLSGHRGLRRPPATSLIHGRHHGRHCHALIVPGNMLVLTHSQHRNTSAHVRSTSSRAPRHIHS